MAHERPKIEAQLREHTGTKYAARLRREGKLPAVIYGHGIDPAHIAVDAETLDEAIETGSHLFELQVGGKTETVLLKDVQHDYLGDEVIHVDLARVDLSEEVEVWVAIQTINEDACAALQQPGTLLQTPTTDLQVRCRADAIPDQVTVDLTNLTSEDSITAGDLALPPGVELVTEPETTIALISFVSEEEVEALEGGEEAEAAAEPELVGAEEQEGEGEGEAELPEADRE